MALEEDQSNFLLMHAMGANTSGQIGSVLAGGVVMALLSGLS
jgi:oxaloacetate decarboxylase beta subunit